MVKVWYRLKEKAATHSLQIGLISMSLGVVLIVVSFFLLTTTRKSEINPEELLDNPTEEYLLDPTAIEEVAETENTEESTSPIEEVYVDVKGAVKKPGVYAVSSDMRMMDVIEMAGGFLVSADQSQINLALKLVDQMVIYVPQIGEEPPTSTEESLSSLNPESEEKESQININTADAQQLQELNGIGEKKAEKIIQYREKSGSFQTIEDLKNVSGIGDKTFESLKDLITVGAE
ncbi:MAG: helix-hairpin-helix domain-containing protein [Desemzia incerta]